MREDDASTLMEARAAWQQRFGSILAELEKSAAIDMSEEELAAFVSEEIEAGRREKREAGEPYARGR